MKQTLRASTLSLGPRIAIPVALIFLAGGVLSAASVAKQPRRVAAARPSRALPAGMPEGGLSPQAREMVLTYSQAVTSARFYRGLEVADIRFYDNVLAPDWLDVPLLPGQGPKRAGFASVLKTYHAVAFPDLRVHIDEIVVAGDTVTSRNTLTGTHSGPFLGVPATGRRVTFRTTDVHHLKNGLIQSSYHLEDLYGAYQQVTAK